MVATDQEKTFFEGLLASLAEKETQARLAQLAANYASQGMGEQILPSQYGGGLLQMVPTPPMQTGRGMLGINPDSGRTREEKMARLSSLLGMLGIGS